MGLADEILVMREGRVVRRFERGQASAEMIVSAAIADARADVRLAAGQSPGAPR